MPKCHPREFPRSGSKAIDVEEREKVSDYNGQYLSPEPKYTFLLKDIMSKPQIPWNPQEMLNLFLKPTNTFLNSDLA